MGHLDGAGSLALATLIPLLAAILGSACVAAHPGSSCVMLQTGSLQLDCTTMMASIFADTACSASALIMHVSAHAQAAFPPTGLGHSWEALPALCTRPLPHHAMQSPVHGHALHAGRGRRLVHGLDDPADRALKALGVTPHSRRRRVLGPSLPPSCSYTSEFPLGDDDDAVSMLTNWSVSVHCSGAGLTAVPTPLPADVQYLHLGHNAFSSLPPNAFAGLTALTMIALTGNTGITALPPAILAATPALEYIYFNRMGLASLPPNLTAATPLLRTLDLSHNQITSVPDGLLRGLSHMTHLYLHYNDITTIPVDFFRDTPNLYFLDLQFNHMSALPVGVFANLTKMQILYLGNNLLTINDPTLFWGMPYLRQLSLQGNMITAVLPGLLSKLSNLTALFLSNNNIAYIDTDMHGRWQTIPVVTLADNPSSCFFAAPLISTTLTGLPNTTVTFLCDCHAGYGGIDFCLPASQIYVPVPPFLSGYANTTVPSNLVNTTATGSSVLLPGLAFYEYIIANGVQPLGGFDVTVGIMFNSVFLEPLDAGMATPFYVPWVQTAFRLDWSTPQFIACMGRGLCEVPLPRMPPEVVQYPYGVEDPIQLMVMTQVNDVIPAQLRYVVSGTVPGLSFTSASTGLSIIGAVLAPGIYPITISATETTTNESIVVAYATFNITICPPAGGPASICTKNGLCIDSGQPYNAAHTCQCFSGWTGETCNITVPPTRSVKGDSTPPAAYLVPLLVGLALIAAGVIIWRRRVRADRNDLHEQLLQSRGEFMKSQRELHQLRKTWEINSSEIEMSDIIGQGGFGFVYRGRWRDMDVAIKTVEGSMMSPEEIKQELDREASMLQTVRHPHIVQFWGAGTLADGSPFLVTELMDLGSLTEVLREHRIDWAAKQRFAREIALGMALVHSLGRMHRDLKSGNLLISSSLHAKVADFGTASIAAISADSTGAQLPHVPRVSDTDGGREALLRTTGLGTPLWMAPEVMQGGAYGPSADVYSFGIVLWEIAAQQLPWQGYDVMCDLLPAVLAGMRPVRNRSWPGAYVDLMNRCWFTQSDARCTFAEALAILERDAGLTAL
eukprot:m.193244 g.193244  ORF g.193244 m.193244 type:complete len:1071 (+) comp10069_c6_seq2:105-3317(+)